MTRIVVVGGGYAGLACLAELGRRLPEVTAYLVEPRSAHVKMALLQQTLRRPRSAITEPFADLADRFGFEHLQGSAGRGEKFTAKTLQAWSQKGSLPLIDAGRKVRDVAFDYLVVATGSRPPAAASGTESVTPMDLLHREGQDLLDDVLSEAGPEPHFTVAGAGATGIQFAFELREALRERSCEAGVRLLGEESQLLPMLPRAVDRYVSDRLQRAGIDYLPGCRFMQQAASVLTYTQEAGDRSVTAASDLSIQCFGVRPYPAPLRADRHGRVAGADGPLANVFAAGDCVSYQGPGLNSLSAQAAIRKGKHVAQAIAKAEEGRALPDYAYRELGYVVSLGALDAVGWALSSGNVLQGLAAYAAKEAVELQYDLLLNGVDTFLL